MEFGKLNWCAKMKWEFPESVTIQEGGEQRIGKLENIVEPFNWMQR